MSATNPELDKATLKKLVWKPGPMTAYAAALIRCGLRHLDGEGPVFFNSDDLPDSDQPGDGSSSGCVVHLLAEAAIIQPLDGNIPDLHIFAGRRKSPRPCCHRRKNQLYRITNRGIAEAWLARHGYPVTRQPAATLFDFAAQHMGAA